MTDISYDDYLEHYGVKGMKWGRRKKRSDTSTDVDTTSDADTSSDSAAPRKVLNRKNLAISAAVIGGVAAVGVSAAIASHRHTEGKKAAMRSKLAEQSKMSLFEMYLNNPPPAPAEPKKSAYKDRHKRSDAKRYGEKGAKRVEKLVDKGYSLRDARSKEFSRKMKRQMVEGALQLAFSRG